jgi:crotonobetainyl-CoA:carnitine CoA-transferase CaiB-like acyl-CoA transferase
MRKLGNIGRTQIQPNFEKQGGKMGETESKGLLSGVKVVELATFVAAPSATRYMSHFGADVIKVEDTRGGGDALRTLCVSLNMPKDEHETPYMMSSTAASARLLLT